MRAFFFSQPEKKTGGGQKKSNGQRAAQQRFSGMLAQQPGDHGRDGGQGDVEKHTPLLLSLLALHLAGQGKRHPVEILPEIGENGDQGAHMQGDVKGEPGLFDMKKGFGQGKMA